MANKPFTTSREKKIAGFLVILLVGWGLYQYGYVAYIDNKNILDKKIQLAEHRLRKKSKLIQKAGRYEEQYKKILSIYGQNGSDDEVMANILSEIETVANNIEIGLSDLKPNRVRKNESFNRFAVNLIVEGQVANIMLFVYTLQTEPYDFYVDEFQLRRKSARQDALRCEMTLSRILLP